MKSKVLGKQALNRRGNGRFEFQWLQRELYPTNTSFKVTLENSRQKCLLCRKRPIMPILSMQGSARGSVQKNILLPLAGRNRNRSVWMYKLNGLLLTGFLFKLRGFIKFFPYFRLLQNFLSFSSPTNSYWVLGTIFERGNSIYPPKQYIFIGQMLKKR